MSPSPSVPSPAATPSYRVFVQAGLFDSLNVKRVTFILLMLLPIVGLCNHFGQGLLGLGVMPLAAWPFSQRCRVEHDGLRVSWLFIRELTPWSDVESVELGEDTRRGVIGKRPPVLLVERRKERRMVVRGRAAVLSQIAAAITAHGS